MPGWGEILAEVVASRDPTTGGNDIDGVRRRYLTRLNELTGRNTVVYATNWMGGGGPASSLVLGDMQGLMEVFRGLDGPNLDLVLHSPGGSAEAADRLVRYMRSKFSNIRVFVPLAAMSAATMWALGGDEIVMGKHSQLGPIDPQVQIGNNLVPASALVRQFQRISDECSQDPTRLSAWLPTLQQYWPGLLEICRDADDLGREMVEKWLNSYMLRGAKDGSEKAKSIAAYFADSDHHKSHSKGIDRDEAQAQGVIVTRLEENQDLQDAVLSVHHAFMITLQGSTTKIIENHLGRAFVQQQQLLQLPQPFQVVPMPQPQNVGPSN